MLELILMTCLGWNLEFLDYLAKIFKAGYQRIQLIEDWEYVQLISYRLRLAQGLPF